MARDGALICSECPKPLPEDADPRRKTCSPRCRSKRHRRLARARREGQRKGAETRHAPAEFSREAGDTDLVAQVAREELTPLVREAITGETLAALQELVGLAPAAVEALKNDLTSSDEEIRQRAYIAFFRYTVGNKGIVQEQADAGKGQLVVNFDLPRPDGAAPADADTTADELRECEVCHNDKPASEFKDDSDRCIECHDRLKKEVLERFQPATDDED